LSPFLAVLDGKVGHDAYAVIRETIRSLDKVALARVVLTNREHVIALEARDKGLKMHDGTWTPRVRADLEARLRGGRVDVNETHVWLLRGRPTRISRQPTQLITCVRNPAWFGQIAISALAPQR
jgi:hypothetical protein